MSTSARRHPAPSPALHTLNSAEYIAHDTRHPDNATTYAVEVPGCEDRQPGSASATCPHCLQRDTKCLCPPMFPPREEPPF